MALRVAINGFGRIGRLALRAAWGVDPARPESRHEPSGAWGIGGLEFVHLNEPACDAESAAHLLTFDSVHGRWPVPVGAADGGLRIGDRRLGFSRESVPAAVDWRALGIDIVLECSGKFRMAETLAPYFAAGVAKVIVAAPVKQGAFNVVMGVNDRLYEPQRQHLLTAASCTTNCLAPLVKVLHEGIGIRHGSITTVHDATNSQAVVDRPHKDLRRARSALLNLIPTGTGSAGAIGLIFPELAGRLDGIAVRVPLLNASLTDAVFEVARPTDVAEVNALFEAAAAGPLVGILGVERRPLVSSDFRGDTRSAVLDALSTMVTGATQVKLLAWYDNEIGYVHRLVELAEMVARSWSAGSTAAGVAS